MQEGNRSTNLGMGCVEGRCSTTQQETCGARQRSILRSPVESPESRRGAQLYRVSPQPLRRIVFFSYRITVYQE